MSEQDKEKIVRYGNLSLFKEVLEDKINEEYIAKANIGEGFNIDENGKLNAEADSGVEITWEEYQKLSDEEKNNGTVYYVTDKDSGGGSGSGEGSYNCLNFSLRDICKII